MSTPWSIEEDRKLRELKDARVTEPEIALKLHRTLNAVKDRWQWVSKSPEERISRRAQMNAYVQRRRSGVRVETNVSPAIRPRADLFDERNRRLAAPMTISAFVFGDPPIGYSALDRRTAQ